MKALIKRYPAMGTAVAVCVPLICLMTIAWFGLLFAINDIPIYTEQKDIRVTINRDPIQFTKGGYRHHSAFPTLELGYEKKGIKRSWKAYHHHENSDSPIIYIYKDRIEFSVPFEGVNPPTPFRPKGGNAKL